VDSLTVDKWRLRSLPKSSLAVTASEKTYTTKHGTVATMKTENIGKRQFVGVISLPESGIRAAPEFLTCRLATSEVTLRSKNRHATK
jgi:hypothetical protein